MNKQQFISEQLIPYFKDKSECGYDTTYRACVYRTSEGKMCVAGKNFVIYKNEYEQKSITELIAMHGETILKPEVRGILNGEEWNLMQGIHDQVAKRGPNVMALIQSLETMAKVNLTELKDLWVNQI
jgi:hypothetical protein